MVRSNAVIDDARTHTGTKINNSRARRARRRVADFRLMLIVALLGLAGLQAGGVQAQQNGFDPGEAAGEPVYAVETQTDGRVLVGGSYTTYGGRVHVGINRTNTNGTLDETFEPATNGTVWSILRLASGKVLVGGGFTDVGGQWHRAVARLNPDGTLDAAFNPDVNGTVFSMAEQVDGRILLAGFTLKPDGQPGPHIIRLNPDGTTDRTFTPGWGADSFIFTVATQADGKILVGGNFTGFAGYPRSHIARLNPDGSLDMSFNPGAGGTVRALAVQADGRILVGGSFSLLAGVERRNLSRLNPDGTIDRSFAPEIVDGAVMAITLQGDGRVLIGGDFGLVGSGYTCRIARLMADGSVDSGFESCVDGTVNAIRIQADRRILLGGDFTHVNGWVRNRIARIFANGKIDSGPIDRDFDPAPNQYVDRLAVQGDGRVLVSGRFGQIGGRLQSFVARLTPDGVAETSFSPFLSVPHIAATPQSDGGVLLYGNIGTMYVDGYPRVGIARLLPNGRVDSSFDLAVVGGVMAVVSQADGSTLVGGNFTQFGGRPHTSLAKLNPDGTVDHTFNASLTLSNANAHVWAIATQEDGKILIGGWFDAVNTQPRVNFARLNPDGTLDRDFNPSLQGNVYSIAVQADGRVIVGGQIGLLGGLADRSNLGRFNADGTLDRDFNPQLSNYVNFIALQADGRAVIGGPFYKVAGQTRYHLARLNTDGTLDGSFDAKFWPYSYGSPTCGVLQADGRLLVGGTGFWTDGGSDISYLARVFNTGPATEDLSLDPTGTSVTWLRGGTGPEVSSVSFEVSADGLNFTPLGTATRVSGGWRLDGLALGQGRRLYIRARGFYATSCYGRYGQKTTSSFVESVRAVEAAGEAAN